MKNNVNEQIIKMPNDEIFNKIDLTLSRKLKPKMNKN